MAFRRNRDTRLSARGRGFHATCIGCEQTGRDRNKAVDYRPRPVEAVQTWLAAAEINSGPVFRAVRRGGREVDTPLLDDDVARPVKWHWVRAGLDTKIKLAATGLNNLGVGSLLAGIVVPMVVNGQSGVLGCHVLTLVCFGVAQIVLRELP